MTGEVLVSVIDDDESVREAVPGLLRAFGFDARKGYSVLEKPFCALSESRSQHFASGSKQRARFADPTLQTHADSSPPAESRPIGRRPSASHAAHL